MGKRKTDKQYRIVSYAQTVPDYFISNIGAVRQTLADTIETDKGDNYDKLYIADMVTALTKVKALVGKDDEHIAVIKSSSIHLDKLQSNELTDSIVLREDQFCRINNMIRVWSAMQTAKVCGLKGMQSVDIVS